MNTIRINLRHLPPSEIRTLETAFDCTIHLGSNESAVVIDPVAIPVFLYCVNAIRSRQWSYANENRSTHRF